jgi:hypothetical protein
VKILVQKQRNGKSSINRDMKPKGGNDWIGDLSCTFQMHGSHVMLSPFRFLGQKKLTQVINANGFLMVNFILFESRWSKNYTLFTTPSSVAVLLIFLKNSYRASTSLTLTAKQTKSNPEFFHQNCH